MSLSALQIVALSLMAIGGLYSALRLFKGPTTPDRIVAADTLAIVTTAGLVFFAALAGNPIYLDIALVYATLAFVGTVAVARSMEGESK